MNLHWSNKNIKIFNGNSSEMKFDDKFHLSVSSPPYFVEKDYEKYLDSFEAYQEMLFSVYGNICDNLIDGGKCVINIADIATFSKFNGGIVQEKMTIPIIIDYLEKNHGMFLMSRIIWSKDDPWANSQQVQYNSKTRHASYRILPSWEYIFVLRKGDKERTDKDLNDLRKKYIDKEQWKKWVSGVWSFRSVDRNNDHPAKFPSELPLRIIQMYSFPGDMVVDPFMGSGTTIYSAKSLKRKAIGCDLDIGYCDLSVKNCYDPPIDRDILERYLELIENPITEVRPYKENLVKKTTNLF